MIVATQLLVRSFVCGAFSSVYVHTAATFAPGIDFCFVIRTCIYTCIYANIKTVWGLIGWQFRLFFFFGLFLFGVRLWETRDAKGKKCDFWFGRSCTTCELVQLGRLLKQLLQPQSSNTVGVMKMTSPKRSQRSKYVTASTRSGVRWYTLCLKAGLQGCSRCASRPREYRFSQCWLICAATQRRHS